jgi:apolipoprotein N-acyltransferase
VPFVNPRWFSGLRWFGGFGIGDKFPVYRMPEGGFGVLVCYESAFQDLSRNYRRDGADFILNITNDGWYGRTWAPAQHAGHLVMRAIETRVGIARAANTGISEFVDPLGRVHLATELNTERMESSVVMTTDVRTLYVRWGDWVALVAIVGAIACVAASYIRKEPVGDTA